jgi:hypothetical protein
MAVECFLQERAAPRKGPSRRGMQSRYARASVTLGVLVALRLLGCAAPRIVEDSPAACANGIDDDGNGQTDCDDPACAATSRCEATADACRDGVDQDENGKVDCEDPRCVSRGFCEAYPAPDCDPARNVGCPVGLRCSQDREVSTRVCTRPGPRRYLDGCENSAECGGGLTCASGLCVRLCAEDAACPRATFCGFFDALGFGICSVACAPALPCPSGQTCVNLGARAGARYRRYGYHFACVPAGPLPIGLGRAKTGAPCDDPPDLLAPALERVCVPTDVCTPDANGGATCRTACLTDRDSMVTCGGGRRCVAADPFDARPPDPYLGSDLYIGVCDP